MNNLLKVALAQISPVWLDKNKTIEKIMSSIADAGTKECNLIIFGEGLLPGYPFWLEHTDGARFNSPGVRHRNDSSESMFAKC